MFLEKEATNATTTLTPAAYALAREVYDRMVRFGTQMAADACMPLIEEIIKLKKENTMATATKKKSPVKSTPAPETAPAPAPAPVETPIPEAVTVPMRRIEDQRASLVTLYAIVLKEEDRPDVSQMDDKTVLAELADNVELLAVEDRANVLALENGAAFWEHFLELNPALAPPVPEPVAAPAKAGKVKKDPAAPKPAKAASQPRPEGPGVIASIQEFLTASGKAGITVDGIVEKLVVRFPSKLPASLKSTVKAQIPSRMMKEKGIKIGTKKVEGQPTLYFVEK